MKDRAPSFKELESNEVNTPEEAKKFLDNQEGWL